MFRLTILHLLFAISWLHAAQLNQLWADTVADNSQELRMVWGGSTARVYQGTISIDSGSIRIVRNLSMQENALGSLRQKSQQTIELVANSATTFSGADLTVQAGLQAKLTIHMRDPATDSFVDHVVSLNDLQQKSWVESLDASGSRIAIERQSYDRLRVETRHSSSTIFECNSIWTPLISGYHTGIAPGEYHLVGSWSDHNRPLAFDIQVHVDSEGNFAEVRPEIRVPETEGALLLEVAVVSRNLISAISGPKILLTRSVDVMAFNSSAQVNSISAWKALLAIDTANAVKPEGLSWLTHFTGSLATRALEAPESIGIPSIDLAEQLNRLIPFSKSVNQYGAVSKGGQVSVRDYAIEGTSSTQRTVVLGPQSWVALPVSGLTPGVPHRMRLQIPIDQPSSLSISIRDTQSDGEFVLVPQSSVEIKANECQSGTLLTHDFVFWPRRDTASIVVASGNRTKSALIGKILVEAAELLVDTKPLAADETKRQTAIYLDQPLIADCFAGPRTKDPTSGRYYETWETWHCVAQRVVQQMQLSGANTLVLNGVSGGNSIVPLQSLNQLHRLDKATFFTDSRSPEMHDFVELLLRHFDRAGLKLVLEIEFPDLEQLQLNPAARDQLLQVELTGDSNPNSNSNQPIRRLNPLNRKSQQALIDPIREIAQRYQQHIGWAGLSIRFNGNSQLIFGGDRWGYNDEILNQFAAETGVAIPGEGDRRNQIFLGPARFRLTSWRAKQMTKFYAQLAQTVGCSAGGPTRLYLNVQSLLSRTVSESEFVTPELISRNPRELLQCYGIDVESLAEVPGLAISSGSVRQSKLPSIGSDTLITPIESSAARAHELTKAVLISHQPRSLKLSDSDDRHRSGRSETWIYPDSARSRNQAKRIILEQLWKSDPLLLGVGGWHPVWANDNDVRKLLGNFASLPPTAMQDEALFSEGAPLKARSAIFQGKAYLTLMNVSPWSIDLRLERSSSHDVQVQTASDSCQLTVESNLLLLKVPAYDIVCLSCEDSNGLKVREAKYRLPTDCIEATTQRLGLLESYLAQAADPGRQPNLLTIGGEFEQWSANNKPVGWTVSALPQTNIQRTAELPRTGQSCILLENHNSEPITAWIQSAPISIPETGRLTLRAWLRSSAADQAQPTVRLGLIGRFYSGQRYQRSIVYGGKQADSTRSLSIDWGRRPAELHVSDLPIDDLVELQISIDLIGPGRIWIDDVEVVQSWLHPDERNYLRGQVLVAKEQLSRNNPFAAELLVGSHWSEYLFEIGARPQEQSTESDKANKIKTEENQADWNRSKSSLQHWRESMRLRWNR